MSLIRLGDRKNINIFVSTYIWVLLMGEWVISHICSYLLSVMNLKLPPFLQVFTAGYLEAYSKALEVFIGSLVLKLICIIYMLKYICVYIR